jgi:hypothetical protein
VHNTQVVVITHSVPFHQHADAIIYVKRDVAAEAGATAEPVTRERLTALSEIAGDLGLNRGELLTGISLFLFVEGLSDRYVLEALFGDRLHSIGAAVVPLHGVRQLPQMIDATILLRYSTARIAFLIDEMDQDRIQELTNNTQARTAARRSKKIEERELANLLEDAIQQGRRPDVLGLPARDIFFLLDDAAVRDTFVELSPSSHPYPGHAALQVLVDSSGDHWKTICEQRIGIPKADVSWYARVADRMRESGSIPKPLMEMIDQLERLSRESL